MFKAFWNWIAGLFAPSPPQLSARTQSLIDQGRLEKIGLSAWLVGPARPLDINNFKPAIDCREITPENDMELFVSSIKRSVEENAKKQNELLPHSLFLKCRTNLINRLINDFNRDITCTFVGPASIECPEKSLYAFIKQFNEMVAPYGFALGLSTQKDLISVQKVDFEKFIKTITASANDGDAFRTSIYR